MSWPWKKTSTEKTMIPVDRVNVGSENELQTNLTNTVEPQTNLKLKDENLSAVKGGWEKAESEVLALKQELEKATQQREALNECELNKKVSKLELENSQLIYSLSSKENLLNELHSVRAQLDYDLTSVVGQLESTQRENDSLSYEIRVLEKELEIRNEEREFNRRTSDVAHKQYLGSVKKIAQLETEAQGLRSLLQKRLPGPTDMAKMKNKVDLTRRKSNPFPIASKITFLTEQLCSFEEENRLLKEFLNQMSKSQTVVPATSFDMGSDEKNT
uniref:Uncharacterized protein n=1 Tax=Lactuca sativa TaxID=4236 RepID=A0A9R1W4P2_LACSA|nr:hypothetical protein LSAT_V11C200096020 [Lactuca sativa]